MSKEFEKLIQQGKHDESIVKVRKRERYQYARSLGFPFDMARRLVGSSKERIDRLAKEL